MTYATISLKTLCRMSVPLRVFEYRWDVELASDPLGQTLSLRLHCCGDWRLIPPSPTSDRFQELAPHATRDAVVPTPEGETHPLRIAGARETKTDRAPWAPLLKDV